MKIKRNLKWGTLILLVGIFCTIFGALNNGVKSIAFDGIRPVVPEKERQYRKSIENEAFDSIDIDVKRAKIKIQRGKHYAVTYQGKKSNVPTISVDNHQLVINQTNNILTETANTIHWKESTRVDRDNSTILITVPENVKLQKVRVFNNYGMTSVLNIDTSMLEVTEMEGGIILKKTAADAVDLEADSGKDMYLQDVDLENGQIQNTGVGLNINDGSLKNMAVDANHGDVAYQKLSVDGGSINNDDGDVTLNKLEIVNGFTVNTRRGNNKVTDIENSAFKLSARNGKNKLFNQSQTANNEMKSIQNTNSKDNILSLTVINGNNVVKQ